MFAKAYLALGVSVVAMALFIGLSGVSYAQTDTPPSGMLETFTWPKAGETPGQLMRLSVFNGPDAWVFTWNAKEAVGLGYRTKLVGGPDVKWQRFILQTNDLNHLTRFDAEIFATGQVGSLPYDIYTSWRFPNHGRTGLLAESGLCLTPSGSDAKLWLTCGYFGELGNTALDELRIGPEVRWKMIGSEWRLRCTFGKGDEQWQLWTFIPVGR